MDSVATGTTGKKRRRQADSPLRVVIVEPHHHILEHIHKGLRQQRRLGTSWSLCHIDAHPDLACPSNGIPAAACFRPHQEWSVSSSSQVEGDPDTLNLYELLDSSMTGISEWILPLVLTGGLTRMDWVKPPSNSHIPSQLPLGTHRYNVGVYVPPGVEQKSKVTSFLDLPQEAVVKVDWDCLYYRDDEIDDFYVPLESLELAQPFVLTSVDWTDGDPNNLSLSDQSSSSDEPWILDICLDYFYCANPFLVDIEAVDQNYGKALQRLVRISSFYQGEGGSEQTAVVDRTALLEFRQCLAGVLSGFASSTFDRSLQENVEKLMPFFSELQIREAKDILDEIRRLLTSLDGNSRSTLRNLSLESLPYLMLPHSNSVSSCSVEEYMESSLRRFDSGLRERLRRSSQAPFLVTIARSLQDGFTPESIADILQARVLDILHDCLQDYTLEIVRDYEACQTNLIG
jgi:hypothetical protein